MNNKKMKIGIVFVISFMIVGYAAVNTTLDLNGNTIVGVNDDLNVFFDGLLINGLDKAELISKAKDSITFKVSDLDLSTNSKLDYLVTNKSTQYDANVTVSCTPNDNDYLRLENTSGAIKVDAMSSNSGSITAFSKNVDSIKKEGTLLYDIVKDQSLGLDTAVGLNYDAISSNTNGKGVYETINTDSGKSVYFYRGEISNNNVIFANTCWQILRTTETNGVKLFYNGPSSNGKCTKPSGSGLGSIYYASAVTDNAYVGYMYGTVGSTTYESTHKNINNSLLKEKIDTWYKDTLLGIHYEEVRDSIEKPILYYEERPGEEAIFYIIDDKITYIYIMSAKNLKNKNK